MNEQDYDPAWIDPRVQHYVAGVRANTGPAWLLLTGPTGSGKSVQATLAARQLSAAPLVVTHDELHEDASAYAGSIDPVRRHSDTDVLVIEDMGARAGTEYSREVLQRILLERYQVLQPTIFTMQSAHRDMLSHLLGDRVYHRLLDASTHVHLERPVRR